AATTPARSGGASTSNGESARFPLIPAQAGIQSQDWVPAFAGTSGGEFIAVASRQAQRRRCGARTLRHGASLGGRRALAPFHARREPPRGGFPLPGPCHP